MPTNFPTSLDAFTNPAAGDALSASTPSHSGQHGSLNDAVEALEAKVGVDNSAVTTSIDSQLGLWQQNVAANSFTLTGLSQLGVVATPAAGVDAAIGSATTVSDGTTKACLDLGQSRTWDTTAGGNYLGLRFQPSITATANMSSVTAYVGSVTKAGAGTVTNLKGFFGNVQANAGTVTTGKAFDATLQANITGSTITTGVGLDVALTTSLGGAITTGIGLRILSNAATTAWGMQVGNFQSYHQGKFAFGGTTAPTWGVELQSTSGDPGSIALNEVTTTPTNPASSAGVVVYHKADKLVFAFNNAGTMRYFTLDLTQSVATPAWAQSTTAP